MTTSPPDSEAPAAAGFAARVAGLVGSSSWSADHDTPKVRVEREAWVEAATIVREKAGLDFFSFLSAIDWSVEVAVGEPLAEPPEERFEVICLLASTRGPDKVVLSTDLAKDAAVLDTLINVFPGANWHEREAAEMFGIDFRGHPNLVKMYLPDAFEGYPLRKSYPLLSREVKPWPGTVDVEGMPTTDNEEAGDGGEEA